ncbi:EVE domain-containing protein [Candidatus Marinamargulisbacteria bacterium SCGC AG-414-C22]|nr:EVE domain-containing protein [Candidatus Marinamargulisbacteria bacterium SCGC AG-414-C22]
MSTQYWLMKTEPTTYSIDDLIAETTTQWEGVRNYQARNFMRDHMKIGDKVLFYHSNCKPPGVVGLAEVCRLAYPDYFALDASSKYFDPKATEEKPIWMMVDVKFVKKFDHIVSLDQLKAEPSLVDMMVIKKGSRLSIQPVTKAEYDVVCNMATEKSKNKE